MPFFGSRKEKQPSKAGGAQGYPTQQAYPTQGAYPTQASAPAGAVPSEQPPPYTPQASSQYGTGPPTQYGTPQQYGAAAPPPVQYAPPGNQYGQPAHYPQQPMYGHAPQGMMGYPQGAYPTHPQIPVGSHVVGHGTFDAGARFNSGAGVNIPPPPPGAMPTAAQYAAAYGGTVTMGQARSGFFSGGSGGGVSTHID